MEGSKRTKSGAMLVIALLALLSTALLPGAYAHCDTKDGPVIMAAQRALETGDIDYALVWVQPDDEAAVKDAFERARHATGAQREAAEVSFFETLVRVHREGEGAEFTGLKPAGQVEPIVALSDRAIEQDDVGVVLRPLTDAMQRSISERYDELQARRNYSVDDVEAGREYVASYVTFMHYVEGIDVAVHASGHDHGAEAGEAGHGGEQPECGIHVQETSLTHDEPRFVTYAGWVVAAIVAASAAVIVLRQKK